ncbi:MULTISPECIES: MFS transporter [Anaerostipes]|uniref:MFS transporter n=1 Tax=Anaerostipes butyraticus TaxID=645466 RepID=A0A916QA12_9FIRM|nr:MULTISPECIES: MFS transporter [Anaerostipes]GFO84783.1 MFS transporter [Anaerostipes butyraticus]HJC81728.1 MFS transporter [Candidatus Anaerostipes avicola]
MDKKYLPSALILYLNYFIHGIGCSILSQQVVKEMLSEQWGLNDVMAVTSIAAALGLGRLISLPFAGPLSDKLGRRLSVLIGCASYVIFFVGIAFSPNTTIAYIAAVLGGIANSFLDTATYPAVAEIIYKYTGIATMGIKFFISVAQLLMPFFLGVAAGTSMSYLMLPLVCGIVIAVLGILAIFAPLPAASESGKSESFISNLKNAHFSIESIALILIGFTSTATFQLWLNCAQTFANDVAGIPSESVSMMQTYYSAGTMVALVVTSLLITKFKQVRFLVIYPAISAVMLVLVYLIKSPMICYVGAFVIGYAAAGGVLQMATAVVNDLFPKIKGTITSLVMIASSLCNYTILTAAAKMTSSQVIIMNIVITVIGVLLAVFVNARYGVLLKNAEESAK